MAMLVFYLMVELVLYWGNNSSMNKNVIKLIVSFSYALLLVGLYYLASLGKNCPESFWDISPFAGCKGGPYFWQGDSEQARMCRAFAETEEGRCGISSYNCPTGYIGQPGLPFLYTPLSDANWKNERCEDKPDCPCVDVGLCSMEKQVE
jgi:hypothetical protein